jgi:serine/threonine protein kinase/tetratricopeptide (TPR) repeat protein
MPALTSPTRFGRSPSHSTLGRSPGDLSAFLPPSSDPNYLWVLSDLVCDDLSQNWAHGNRRTLNDYCDTFPELFRNPSALRPVVDREYQLRKAAGANPDPGEYESRFGVKPPSALANGFDSARSIPPDIHTPFPTGGRTAVHNVVPVRAVDDKPTRSVSPSPVSFDEFEQVPSDQFPKVGELFEGFRLKELLGRGAFAQVYLAEQIGLSNREVAIKLTRRLGKEANRLARLQHANIVPIFSFHAGQEWQALCMPYFGRQTLEEIVRHVRKSQAVPKSGCEVFSTIAARGDVTVRSTTPKSLVPGAEPMRPTEAGSRGELRNALSTMPYADAAILLVAQIADGLAHAHSLGIWHLDLKPANVLVSDHGQPMLLDFNLAFDSRNEHRERFGGTVPYMAPEQLEEMIESRERNRKGLPIEEPRVSRVDERTDLYSAGVLLFELLTGRHPFPIADADRHADPFVAALTARLTPRKTARQINPDLSPGIDAVIERLLAHRKEDRYPSAAALRQDLLNHLEHQPLAHVRVPSLAERFAKWRLRNPKALPRIAALVAVCGTALAMGWGTQQWRASTAFVAREHAKDFRTQLPGLRMDLIASSDSEDARTKNRGLENARSIFLNYGIAVGVDPTSARDVRRLPPQERISVLHDLGEIAAIASILEETTPKGAERAAGWSKLADDCFRDARPAVLGGTESGPRNDFLAAVIALRDGRTKDAEKLFDAVVKVEPNHAAAQYLYALTLNEQFQFSRAAERFEMAAALAPDDDRPAYKRGLILQADRKYAKSEIAFSEALKRNPKSANAYLHRAQVRLNQGNATEALADCNAAIEHGGATLRALALRSSVHRKLGNAAEEAKDRTAAFAATPLSAADYIARGVSRCPTDPKGALADFRAATTLQPRAASAWNNQAYVLGEKLHETDQAIAAMDKAVEANSQSGEMWLGRAVLLARVGKRDFAHADVAEGLLLSDNPRQTYQAACVFALTSRTNPADAEQAVVYLRQAVRDGYRNLTDLNGDSDIDAIRKRDDVRKIIDAVNAIVK